MNLANSVAHTDSLLAWTDPLGVSGGGRGALQNVF